MRRGSESTLDLIGITDVREHSIVTKRNGEIVYFLVKPSNLSVLSEESINKLIYALMTVMRDITDMGIMCLNSRENFEDNKRFLRERIDNEPSPVIRNLLQHDLTELDNMQTQMATSREFIINVKIREKTERDKQIFISRIDKLLTDQGFTARLAGKDDIKRIFAVYYAQDVTTDYFDDYEGERWFAFNK